MHGGEKCGVKLRCNLWGGGGTPKGGRLTCVVGTSSPSARRRVGVTHVGVTRFFLGTRRHAAAITAR